MTTKTTKSRVATIVSCKSFTDGPKSTHIINEGKQTTYQGSSSKGKLTLRPENLNTLLSCKRILENNQINNEEKLKRLINDSEMNYTLRNILIQGEVSPRSKQNISEDSVLKLTVASLSNARTPFELVKDDIVEVHLLL